MLGYRWIIECNNNKDIDKLDNKIREVIKKHNITDDRLIPLLNTSTRVNKGDMVIEALNGDIVIIFGNIRNIILN